MGKFSVTVNNASHDGFKMNFNAGNPDELKIFEGLTKELISKITKIEVSVSNEGERY